MQITVRTAAAGAQKADVLIVGVPTDTKRLPRSLAAADALVGGLIARDVAEGTLKGKLGACAWYRPPVGSAITHVLVVGLGAAGDLDAATVRRAAYVAAQAAAGKQAKAVAMQVLTAGRKPTAAVAAGAMAEGAVLATFDPKNWVSAKDEDAAGAIERVMIGDVPGGQMARARKAVTRGRILGEAGNFTKFLQNEPANAMTPNHMAKHARALGRKHGLQVQVLSKAQCEKLGMGSYVSVSNGSAQPPQFLVLRYRGRRSAKATLALVGKGVTFDTGGISLKPSAGMEEMKYDMSGAANVLGAMSAIAQLKPAANVVGLCACTENMPSGSATKPGDIVRAMNGKTIEVINTDAEGRLVLADALCYAVQKVQATHMIDLATLTGACVVALGHDYAAAMTNDDAWLDRVSDAADRAGEKIWELPMDAHYGEAIKSKIADIKNVGNRAAGTIIGAKFLEHFVEDTPWVHLDIAGVAWVDTPEPGMPKGPTATPMRTLVEVAEAL